MSKPGAKPDEVRTRVITTINEARQACVTTCKVHYKESNAWGWTNPLVGLGASLAAVGLKEGWLSTHKRLGKASPLIWTLAAAGGAAFSAIVNPGQRAEAHKHAGAGYGALDRSFRLLQIPIEAGAIVSPAHLAKYEALLKKKSRLDSESPIASQFWHGVAKRDLQAKAAKREKDGKPRSYLDP